MCQLKGIICLLIRSEQLIKFVVIFKPDVCIISSRHYFLGGGAQNAEQNIPSGKEQKETATFAGY